VLALTKDGFSRWGWKKATSYGRNEVFLKRSPCFKEVARMMTQDIVAAKSAKLMKRMLELLEIVSGAIDHHIPAHEVEVSVLSTVLSIGHDTMQLLFDQLGAGDVGETCLLNDGRILKRLEELKSRSYQTVFGTFELERHAYASREGQKAELIPLDARLSLPASKFSFLLQDFNQHLATEEPFEKVADSLERILNVSQHVDSLERMNQAMAAHVEDFHARQQPPPASEEGTILVETADGKGVPIRRPADAASIENHEHRPGPKPDRKKMATLASVYSVDLYPRTPEDIVEALFRDPNTIRNEDSTPRPAPCHKRVRACLNYTDSDGDLMLARPAMFGWMADEVAARNPDGAKTVVCIQDGEENLWEEIDVHQKASQRVEILDLLHVTPRLWKAARIFTKSDAEASAFVRLRLLHILRGGVTGVVRRLKQMSSRNNLTGSKKKTIAVICAYLMKHVTRMQYHEYLAAGYPIASGVIEGACRNVVKDRMERSGMNWTVPGANAMLHLRCIHVCGDWDTFIEHYIASETKKLHPHKKILETLTWSAMPATSA
jgi:hypothetical protein